MDEFEDNLDNNLDISSYQESDEDGGEEEVASRSNEPSLEERSAEQDGPVPETTSRMSFPHSCPSAVLSVADVVKRKSCVRDRCYVPRSDRVSEVGHTSRTNTGSLTSDRLTPDYSRSTKKRSRYEVRRDISVTPMRQSLLHRRNSPSTSSRPQNYMVPSAEDLHPQPHWVDSSGTFKSIFLQDDGYRTSVKSTAISGDYAVKLEIYSIKEISGIPIHEWWEKANFRAFIPVGSESNAMRTALRLQDMLVEAVEMQEDVEGIWQRNGRSQS